MPRFVSHYQAVGILLVRLKKSTNELRIKIDTPWEGLSAKMKDKLFEEAQRIYDEKYDGQLESGWTPKFYSYKILVQGRTLKRGGK